MQSRFRHGLVALFFLLVASCSGGGCSGCAGCAGSTPLPGGFPTDKAVTNGVALRVSRPGLDFLETQLPAIAAKATNTPNGTLTIDIPQTDPPKTEIADLSIFGEIYLDTIVCEGGPSSSPSRCQATVGVGASRFTIDSIKPNAVKIKATVPLKLTDTPLSANVSYDPPIGGDVDLGGLTIHLGYGDGGCSGGVPNVTPHDLPIGIVIPLVADTTTSRKGYSRIDVDNAQIDLSDLSSSHVRVCSQCGGGIADEICSAITDSGFVKGLLIDPLRSGLESQVKELLRDQLCTAPNPQLNPACPATSSPDAENKKCVFDADKTKCVPLLLGTDAHLDLGSALSSFSPGTTAGLDFGIAAAGNMNPAPGADANPQGRTPNGITLGVMGGVLAQPASKCVNPKVIAPPTGILLPDELAPTAPDAPGTPHVGIALAGRFLDYSFTSVFNSGALCLGVSTEQVDMLKSGLLSLLIPSVQKLTFDQRDAAAAIATRPQEPPVVKIGGGTDVNKDPLLLVTLPKFALDFYIWSYDRFARVFTYTADLSIPLNLQTGKDPVKNPNGGLLPAIGEIKVANGQVTNSDLLLDQPSVVAGAVGGVFGTISKALVGNTFSPVDLSSAVSSLGLGMEINDIKKLSKGSDDYIGLFATLNKAATPATVESDTTAKLVGKRVWADAMTLTTYDEAKLPELDLELSSSLEGLSGSGTARAIEYSWWIDEGTHAPWSTEKHLRIKNQQLFFQGRHVLHVSSRIAGEMRTEDATPAEIPYVIDALAPAIKVTKAGSGASIEAWDVVSKSDVLVARYRLDSGEFTPFRPLAEIANVATGSAESIEVEVKDEEGNIGSIRQSLIRGKADGSLASDSGCSCEMPGRTTTGTRGVYGALFGLAALALVGLRRRFAGALRTGTGSRVRSLLPAGASARTALAAIGAITAVAATSQGCACGSEADLGTGCGDDCNQQCATGLKMGQPGAYLSLAKAADGSLWGAGYNDALLADNDSMLFGDLVVGKYDPAQQRFLWDTVDGVPVRTDGTCGAFEPNGWRKGETNAGDNVGRYSSLQVVAGDKPIVTYYDDTNKALKLAVKEGDEWKVATLRKQDRADIGRYAKMILVDGKPVIAFLQLEPGTDRLRSRVVVARSRVEVPHVAEDFDFQDAAVDEEAPCRANSCAPGRTCIKETGICSATVGGCNPACGDTEACVTKDGKATCLAKQGEIETYPRALGAFISLANGPRGLGIATYDGNHGNLVALVQNGAKFDRFIIDGETGSRADKTALDTGDSGIAASLVIGTDGTWHVSYVNGMDETLRYITFRDGKAGRSEVVDDGTGVDGNAFRDGKHIVGDDSVLKVDGDTATIYYADSTSLGLRRAVGRGGAGAKKWDLRTVPQPNRWVAFPQFIPGEAGVAAWWRQSMRETGSVEADVIILR